jgi:hypothetical protein
MQADQILYGEVTHVAVAVNLRLLATEFSGEKNSVFADPVLQGGC